MFLWAAVLERPERQAENKVIVSVRAVGHPNCSFVEFGKRAGKRQADAGALFLAIAFQPVEGFENTFSSFLRDQRSVIGEADGKLRDHCPLQAYENCFFAIFYG